ncbi:hypothetical protein [Treponema bryantii]|uniref:hypothetical protein n=1 Tax=Treponema bryantii TaxID=163 RepID=UPI002B29F11D|nr:hypothetical protein TRBR_29300 [Treponema bryantii]
MELTENQKTIIGFLRKEKSLIEILKSQLSFELKEQDISNIHQNFKVAENMVFDEVIHSNTGFILTLEESAELNTVIKDINTFLKLLETKGLITISNKSESITFTVLNKDKIYQYVTDLTSQNSLRKFFQQTISLDNYFYKFSKTFRTKDEEKKYKNERFNNFKNGKLVFLLTIIFGLFGAIGGAAAVYSCSNKKNTKDIQEEYIKQPQVQDEDTDKDIEEPQSQDSELVDANKVNI